VNDVGAKLTTDPHCLATEIKTWENLVVVHQFIVGDPIINGLQRWNLKYLTYQQITFNIFKHITKNQMVQIMSIACN